MKKLISLFAVIILLLSLSVSAMAADTQAPENKGSLYDYQFRFFSREDAQALALEIAQSSWFEAAFTESGISTVFVSVNLRSYPELSNPAIFVPAVRNLVRRMPEFVPEGSEQVELLNETRFAGELALHIFGLMIADSLKQLGFITADDPIFILLDSADMNIDETRVPEWIMDLTGTIIMNIMGFMF